MGVTPDDQQTRDEPRKSRGKEFSPITLSLSRPCPSKGSEVSLISPEITSGSLLVPTRLRILSLGRGWRCLDRSEDWVSEGRVKS